MSIPNMWMTTMVMALHCTAAAFVAPSHARRVTFLQVQSQKPAASDEFLRDNIHQHLESSMPPESVSFCFSEVLPQSVASERHVGADGDGVSASDAASADADGSAADDDSTLEDNGNVQNIADNVDTRHAASDESESGQTQRMPSDAPPSLVVGDLVGSGSYGTVRYLHLVKDDGAALQTFIGKRPWTQSECLQHLRNPPQSQRSAIQSTSVQQPQAKRNQDLVKQSKQRHQRCQHYWEVERQAYITLADHPNLPTYRGVNATVDPETQQSHEWMLFDVIPDTTGQHRTAMSVKHHMEHGTLQQALSKSGSFEEMCRSLIYQLLTIAKDIHSHGIIHRDIKPDNLLISNFTLYLIDFGSAADLSQQQKNNKSPFRFLMQDNVLAVSPLYTPPEVYNPLIDMNSKANLPHQPKFDIYSIGMVACQIIFNLFQDESDASFHQQVQKHDYDLNLWLLYELGSVNLRPHGVRHAIFETDLFHDGLWKLLCRMIQKDFTQRPTAQQALALPHDDDDPFFTRLLQESEYCTTTASRPLHFVATFSKAESFGLILSEPDDADDALWQQACRSAQDGEVLVKEVMPNTQASTMNCFQIGDRLRGVGEFPFSNGGFEQVLTMLSEIPSRNVKLHFDRLSVRTVTATSDETDAPAKEIHVADYGAWSSIGKRSSQEDAYILHEIQDEDQSVLLAGVLDGHGGSVASNMVSETLPSILSNQLLFQNQRHGHLKDALDHSWEHVCDMYRSQCVASASGNADDDDTCMAPYDAREGILDANIGGVMAGTTASILALDEHEGKASLLNCGDSRSMIISPSGDVHFATQDHTPQDDIARLQKGIDDGLDYALPQCNLSRWWVTVGEYEYGVSRSLEGPLATSKGIVSDADVVTRAVLPGMIVVAATDGLWNVMDSVEVARDLHKLRHEMKQSARDAAHTLSSMALQKGSDDNVSAVVVYL